MSNLYPSRENMSRKHFHILENVLYIHGALPCNQVIILAHSACPTILKFDMMGPRYKSIRFGAGEILGSSVWCAPKAVTELPWRKTGPPNHLNDKANLDQ